MALELDFRGKLKDSYKHFSTGVSAMLPFIMMGALGQAIAILLGGGSAATIAEHPILQALRTTGQLGMGVFVAIMAGYISQAIGGKLALAPGFIAGSLAVTGGAGYLGGILGAFLAGYLTYVIVQAGKNLRVEFKSTYMNLVPALGGLLVAVFIIVVVNPPVQRLMANLIVFFGNLALRGRVLFGLVVGLIPGFDYGGPLSQAKFQAILALRAEGLPQYMGISTGSGSTPPIGMCLAVLLAPHLYRKEIREYGRTGIIYALVGGWTEIAIPFVLDDPKNTMIASMLGGAVGSIVAALLELEKTAPIMGILGVFTMNKPWGWFVAVGAGALTVALITNFLRAREQRTHPLEERV